MPAKIGNTLARRALWIFTPLISLTIIAGVLLLFEHFFLSAQSLYLEQVALYAKERIARERVHFQLAESHLNKVQDSFVLRFNALDQPDYNTRFQQLMQLEDDGSWRNATAFSDLNEYSGNYIDDDTPVTDELKKKMVIFSDGLDADKILDLYRKFSGRVRVSFGWGTLLTNDFRGLTTDDRLAPFSLVCKAVSANGHPTVKLSDNPNKAMGPQTEIARYKRVFGVGEQERREVVV